MKATKYLSMAALALMGTLASCQSDDEATTGFRPDNAVSLNFSVGSLQGTTRSNAVATDDTQRQFNQGDQIAVSTNDQEAVLFQCTSTENQTWTEAVPNKFLLWTQKTLTFSAYYPATTGTSMTTFTVPTDQSSVEKIALADYMTRQQLISRPEGGSDIQMQLERKMARVIVRISGFGSQYRDDQKTVDNVRIYSEASGIADGNPTGSSTEIQPYAQGSNDGWGWSQNSTFTALVVPGYGDSGARFIQLTDGEGSTLLVKGIPELEAGNSYTFNLVVGKNRIEVASVTVQDWTTGETLAGGQAQEQAAAVPITVTWNKDDITGSGKSFTKDGVTITAGYIDFGEKNFMQGGTFTTTLGNFTKIEVTTGDWDASGTGWSGSGQSGTWTGTPASSVSFSGDIMGMSSLPGQNTKFVFTIEPAN
ncbi:fimbrillin family protein [Prevotella communis]|uniref:fimbrillin family protein n=1 Tax=Prevotella communis TaxID=2913614 RepID=UPI001EDC5AC8|nr:fimbrillin family protein [Prevotella communis]UKK63058.1 fimbrillin family protein [Prevotella communis]UKK65883.1 fimbrillin family protein [Prevotella communis]UKK68313.1 fimbrillin family protein [Prevotella communis]UKK69552.1 fimbrillin family protein [Prevotella communis]